MRKSLSKNRSGFLAVLDVGTTKVCCVVARVETDGSLRVVGVGHQVSRGMKAGAIIDMEGVETSILNAVHSAEQAAGHTIREVYVNVVGGRPISQIIDIEANIGGNAVDETDIKAIMDQGQMACQGEHREIIHAIPLTYTIDQNQGIRDPRGMFGDQMALKLHVLQTPLSPLRNLATCIHRCHLDIAGFVVTPYASALGVLSEDETDLGVTLVDMGGGTTSIAVFLNGEVIYADVVPVGGDHVTNDLARGLSTPLNHAERLKTLYGSAIPSPSDDRELVMVPQVGENDYADAIQVAKSSLTAIIQPRVEEIFEMVKGRLEERGMQTIAGRRLVLTGGASQIFGVKEIASQILEKQVRLAKPLPIQGLAEAGSGAAFATCAGLLTYGRRMGGGKSPSSLFLEKGNSLLENIMEWFRQRF
jgi:cell division protein FtsA